MFKIDYNCTNESTEYTASALQYFLRKVFPDSIDVKLGGKCTNSGGDDTQYTLGRALVALNLVGVIYLFSTCCLQNFKTIRCSTVTTVM